MIIIQLSTANDKITLIIYILSQTTLNVNIFRQKISQNVYFSTLFYLSQNVLNYKTASPPESDSLKIKHSDLLPYHQETVC